MSAGGSGPATIFMSDDRALAFVDTNVLVYALENRNSPKKRVAQRLLDELMDSDRLRVSTQVLQELFVTLTRKVAQPCSNDEAAGVLEDLAAWPLVVIDYPAIRAAVGLADQAKLSLGCAGGCGGGAERCGGAVHRRSEPWAGDSRGPDQQSIRWGGNAAGVFELGFRPASLTAMPPRSNIM